MPRKHISGSQTRQRLLDSACRIFAEKGYRDATIASICEAAEANIAAVNYHFSDKQSLYGEAVRYAYSLAATRYPIDGGLSPESPPGVRLRAHVEAHLRRTLSDDEASYFPRIMIKEFAEPTSVSRTVVRDVLRPHRDHLRGILCELLGEQIPDEQIRLAVISIISQCYFFGFNRSIRERHFGAGRLNEARLLELIEHITEFSLAGLHNMREQLANSVEAKRNAR